MKTYFKDRIEGDKDRPVLPYNEKPCHDCAVIDGFYAEISDALKKEPIEIQKQMAEKWFCHNDSSKACRGNSNYLGLTSASF